MAVNVLNHGKYVLQRFCGNHFQDSSITILVSLEENVQQILVNLAINHHQSGVKL
jgi:hypothetical protein